MRRISFNQKFVNEAGNDLISNKIHTLRRNYDYWQKFEGQEVELFVWKGKPYRSKQKVFCVKRIVSVQEIEWCDHPERCSWAIHNDAGKPINLQQISKNDGFEHYCDFISWFTKFLLQNNHCCKMAIIWFTEGRY